MKKSELKTFIKSCISEILNEQTTADTLTLDNVKEMADMLNDKFNNYANKHFFRTRISTLGNEPSIIVYFGKHHDVADCVNKIRENDPALTTIMISGERNGTSTIELVSRSYKLRDAGVPVLRKKTDTFPKIVAYLEKYFNVIVPKVEQMNESIDAKIISEDLISDFESKRFGSKYPKNEVDPETQSVVYYDPEKLLAIGYSGRRAKHDFHYKFQSMERMEKYIKDYFESKRKDVERKIELQKKKNEGKKALIDKIQVGDILYTSWGYDQTNLDFYQVIKKAGSILYVQEIAQERKHDYDMSGTAIGIKDKFVGQPIKVMIASQYIKIQHQLAFMWDGHPKSWSSYA